MSSSVKQIKQTHLCENSTDWSKSRLGTVIPAMVQRLDAFNLPPLSDHCSPNAVPYLSLFRELYSLRLLRFVTPKSKGSHEYLIDTI